MTKPYINPLGFIHRHTSNGVRFLLTNPDDSRTLRIGTPVTVSQPSSDGVAVAKTRGKIVAVGYATATFIINETDIGKNWPENEATLREKTPVYLAKGNSFEPDPSRALTAEQMERLRRLSRKYHDILRDARNSNEIPPETTRYRQPLASSLEPRSYPQQLDE